MYLSATSQSARAGLRWAMDPYRTQNFDNNITPSKLKFVNHPTIGDPFCSDSSLKECHTLIIYKINDILKPSHHSDKSTNDNITAHNLNYQIHYAAKFEE